ncbi:hypothetical protein AAFF_G00194500 [Aldrovandia affinis]|uniref:Methyl-CpG-binding domain protein 1 n=1 Tax=Aldrovandia affinis TaxID=143900 RepID=A0AAD7WV06_9TELE|nr:hypothetical protein AAFF_G00194500 [Aldrovandia affinis]
MNEGLLNHLTPEGGPEEEGVGGDTDIDAQLNQTAEATAGREDALTREQSAAAEELTRQPTEALTTKPPLALAREQAEALTRELIAVTEALTREEADESSDDGLEGTSEGSIQLESQTLLIGADFEEHCPTVLNCKEDVKAQSKGSDADGAEDPPVDWLEPLEEDDEEDEDRQSWELDLLPGERKMNGNREAEKESLAGESERSGSVAGSERNVTQKGSKSRLAVGRRRRRQALVDEEWEEWPILGEGWKRKEVFRLSGFSVGKTDTYYMSPDGNRLRSKIELAKNLAGAIDISTFDFKSGKFLDKGTIRRIRKLKKNRKMFLFSEKTNKEDWPYSSDISLNSTPHSQRPHITPPRARFTQQRNTSSPHPFSMPPRPVSVGNARTLSHSLRKLPPLDPSPAASPSRDASFPLLTPPQLAPPLAPVSLTSTPHSHFDIDLQGPDALRSARAFSRQPGSRSPGRTFKKEAVLLDCTPPELLVSDCSNCGSPVAGMELWRKGQTSWCLKCKSEKRKDDSRNIVFRKWLPCGQCRACLVSEDCGMCASCRSGQLNHKSHKPVRCRKRKCLCPIRKKMAKEGTGEKEIKKTAKLEGQYMISATDKVMQYSIHKDNNSELTVCLDSEDDDKYDMDEDGMEDGLRKCCRQACGRCTACLYTEDCGSCDFCIDKPKFGGNNKKRQKCHLRQCHRQAMNSPGNIRQGPSKPLHPQKNLPSAQAGSPTCKRLVPFQLGLSDYRIHEGWVGLGKPRPHYSYSGLRGSRQKTKVFWDDLEFTEDEDDDCLVDAVRPGGYRLEEEADKDSVALTSQNSFKADSGRIDILKKKQFPTRVPDTSPPPRTPPQGSDALYSNAGLAVGPESERFGKASERWGLKEKARLDGSMDIVEVEAGELEITPMISEIFSLAEGLQAGSGADLPSDPELLSLLEALRRMELPAHWLGLLVEGPSLQLLQCSKNSTMADTSLYIDSGFYYQISVQDQPLLLTHPIYKDHPRRLPTVAHVVALLLDLERYAVCQGCPASIPRPSQAPILPTRSAVCQFLVLKTEERCDKCSATPQVL